MLGSNVRFNSESGMCNAVADVRFGPIADMLTVPTGRLAVSQKGNRKASKY